MRRIGKKKKKKKKTPQFICVKELYYNVSTIKKERKEERKEEREKRKTVYIKRCLLLSVLLYRLAIVQLPRIIF